MVACGWPYVNYLPHLGTLIQVLSADVVARYYRLRCEEVILVSGSDEHGTPIEVEALRLNIPPKQLTDANHARVVELFKKWGFSFNNYTRTENSVHKDFVRKHLMKIYKNGYIFSQETEMPYCKKCRRFLPDRFVEGKCPYCRYEAARGDQCDSCGRLLEPKLLVEPYCAICNDKPTIKRTKHWYFDLPRFSKELSDFIGNNKQLPSNTAKFSLNFIEEGLKPRAVTRDVEWGIPAPFPDAEGKTIYVWVEAVLGYVSATIEYFKRGREEEWKEYWFDRNTLSLYFIGKDNIPFHTIIFPALLLAAHEDYNLPSNVSATEFLQYRGEPFSKSRRIGVSIDEALELFPADCWRYFLMATRPEKKDMNFQWEVFIEKVNSALNDTFGNFIHRSLTFINSHFDNKVPMPSHLDKNDKRILEILRKKVKKVAEEIEACRLQAAANTIVGISRMGNQYLNEKEPWKVVKEDKDEAATIIYVAVQIVKALAIVSSPLVPFAAEELWKTLNMRGSVHEQEWGEALKPLQSGHKILEAKPLFQKIKVDGKELDTMLEKARESIAKAA